MLLSSACPTCAAARAKYIQWLDNIVRRIFLLPVRKTSNEVYFETLRDIYRERRKTEWKRFLKHYEGEVRTFLIENGAGQPLTAPGYNGNVAFEGGQKLCVCKYCGKELKDESNPVCEPCHIAYEW